MVRGIVARRRKWLKCKFNEECRKNAVARSTAYYYAHREEISKKNCERYALRIERVREWVARAESEKLDVGWLAKLAKKNSIADSNTTHQCLRLKRNHDGGERR